MEILSFDLEKVAKLKKYAEENPFIINTEKDFVIAGDNEKHVLHAGTFRIVFSIEYQKGKYHVKHLSVSNNTKTMNLRYKYLKVILELFGFSIVFYEMAKSPKHHIWVENGNALNIIEAKELTEQQKLLVNSNCSTNSS